MRGIPNTIGEHPALAAARVENTITIKVFHRTGVNEPLKHVHDVCLDIRSGDAPRRAHNHFAWYATRAAARHHAIRVEVGGQLDTLENFLAEGQRNGVCYGQ